MNLETLFQHPVFALFVDSWLMQFIAVVIIALLANIVSHYALNLGEKIARLSDRAWEIALVRAARWPLPTLIWLVAGAGAVNILAAAAKVDILISVSLLRNSGIVLCLAWFAWRFISHLSSAIVDSYRAKKEEIDITTYDALSKLARLIVLAATLIAIMQTFGISVSGLLAAGGIGGLAVGFAAKDLLANFFGGLTIYLDRPFSVGDWVRSPDKDIEGIVEHISWRHTRVRAFNKNPIYVPNALFTTIIVENPSRMSHRRIHETIGIRYDDIASVDAIVSDIKSMLRNHPEIDPQQTLIVAFNTFGPSSLDLFIYTYTRTTDWTHYHAVKQDILLRTAKIIEGHHAQIAYPTQTLFVKTEPA